MIKKIIFLIFLHVICTNLMAQNNFAVIYDSDGFVNVRQAGVQSKITGKLQKYQPFDCLTEEDPGQKIKDMIYIEYGKFTKSNGGIWKNVVNDSVQLSGYIHKSRIYKLNDMPQLNLKSVFSDKMQFANDTIQVIIESAKFDANKHTMRDFEKKIVRTTGNFASGQIATIDGQRVWGVDGDIPHSEIKSITIAHASDTLSFPREVLKNIFEPNMKKEYTKVCLGADGEIYIWMHNGDGAGSYNVIWVIKDGKVKHMFTGISWYA